ncbi:MAG: lycopene beta-cyclase CrtY [Pseudomonadota bacterium]
MTTISADIAIAGGGLSGALIAWRLKQKRPDLKTVVVERGDSLGGNHTWSFHETDLPADIAPWFEPLVVYSWPRQHIRFPKLDRTLQTGYRSITSERLHEVIAPTLGEGLVANAEISSVDKSGIQLKDGRFIQARAVIDARGQRRTGALTIGFQKFAGQVLKFKKPHGLDAPIIMDATVPQTDGYRFVYVLPFTADTALVEDTYYADGAAYDPGTLAGEIHAYCERQGWEIDAVLREEDGLLPIAMAGDIEAHLAGGAEGVGLAGLGAGLFHPLTGYSLPDAARLAEKIADADDVSGDALYHLCRDHAITTWNRRGFYRMLSRFLFDAAEPRNRYLVMRRFYKLNRGLIERFYAGVSTMPDKMRVLTGKPPVGFMKAVRCVDEAGWLNRLMKAEGQV